MQRMTEFTDRYQLTVRIAYYPRRIALDLAVNPVDLAAGDLHGAARLVEIAVHGVNIAYDEL